MTNINVIKISEEIYNQNFENIEEYWYDDDCDCFDTNINGKFYLYVVCNENEYELMIFDTTLEKLLCDDEFVAKLAKDKINTNPDNFCDFCSFISDCMNGYLNIEKRPFEFHDIAYCVNYLI